jgi:hypothetical protein
MYPKICTTEHLEKRVTEPTASIGEHFRWWFRSVISSLVMENQTWWDTPLGTFLRANGNDPFTRPTMSS